MKDLDFSAISTLQPEAAARAAQVAVQSPHYEPALAQDFFRAAGTQEVKPAGQTFFSENEKTGGLFAKGARMYLLLDGEISLKPCDGAGPLYFAGETSSCAAVSLRAQAYE